MADYIPFAIQAEIMKRLPTRSLMRFRSVSKPWKSLIDSPKFIADYSFNKQHLLVSYSARRDPEQKYLSFVDDDTFPLEKVSLQIAIPGLKAPKILGSSQGLFCLYGITSNPREPLTLKAVHLWNPSIRKSVAIDVSYVVVPRSFIVIGFGVCPHTSDPKLVKIQFGLSRLDMSTILYTPWQVEVYTLSSRAWRSIPTINQPRSSVSLRYQVVVNEFIYWHAVDRITITVGTPPAFQGYNLVVSFDMTSERFMEIPLPDALACADNNNVVISNLKESLVAIEVVKEAEKQVYGVWKMECGVSNSWTKLFSINSPDASIQEIRGFWKINEPIFAMTSTESEVNDLVVREYNSEHIKYIGISGNGLSYSARSYMETLLLLDH